MQTAIGKPAWIGLLLLLGACVAAPEPTEPGGQTYRAIAHEEHTDTGDLAAKQVARKALRQAALGARRLDADYLRVVDVQLFMTTEQMTGGYTHAPVNSSNLVVDLLAIVAVGVIQAAHPPDRKVLKLQADLAYEVLPAYQQPGAESGYLEVTQLLAETAPMGKDYDGARQTLPPQVKALVERARQSLIQPVDPGAKTTSD